MIKLEPKYASFCPKCKMGWFYPIDMPDSEKKQVCGYKGCDGVPIHTKMLNVECGYIYCISEDRDFLKAMNDLRNNDIIAYKAKVAEFKAIYKQNHPDEVEDENGLMTKPKTQQPTTQSKPQIQCPYCNSTNTKKITAMDRIGSNIMFGIFSKKRNKEWHCESCGSDF